MYSTVINVAYKNCSVAFLVLTLGEDTFSCNVTIFDSCIYARILIDSELRATNIQRVSLKKAGVNGSKSK